MTRARRAVWMSLALTTPGVSRGRRVLSMATLALPGTLWMRAHDAATCGAPTGGWIGAQRTTQTPPRHTAVDPGQGLRMQLMLVKKRVTTSPDWHGPHARRGQSASLAQVTGGDGEGCGGAGGVGVGGAGGVGGVGPPAHTGGTGA